MTEQSWCELENSRVPSFSLDCLTPHERRARQKQWKMKFEVQKLFTLNQVRKCLVSHRRGALAKRTNAQMGRVDRNWTKSGGRPSPMARGFVSG